MQPVVQIIHSLLGSHMTAERTTIFNVTQHTGLVFIPRQPIKMLFVTISIEHRLCCKLHGKHGLGIPLILDIPQRGEVFLQRVSPTVDHLLCIIKRTVHIRRFLTTRILDRTATSQINLR